MVPATLLLHATPDGLWHYDLMVCPPGLERSSVGPDDRVLLTWRLRDRIDLGPGACLGEPLSPHRWAYLTYEGPTRGGNGHVRRVGSGEADWRGPDRLGLRWRSGEQWGAWAMFTLVPSPGGVLFRRS